MNSRDEKIMISDEQLSAFLDAELPEAEMEMIRQQLSEDDVLADRLADLAMVDNVVSNSYSKIDARPLPRSVTNLLADNESSSSNIIKFPLLKKIQTNIQQHAAIAASVALILGFGITQILRDSPNTMYDWKNVSQVLETTSSGTNRALASGIQVKPQLTFFNKDEDVCRQFQVRDHKGVTENIACREDNKWELSTSVRLEKNIDANTYQTASGGSVLDSEIEDMLEGDFFDKQAEAAAIAKHWAIKK